MYKPLPHDTPSSGSYAVTDPLTKILCTASTFEGLVNRVGQVRAAMGCASGLNLREELEQWICSQLPQDCTEVDMSIPQKRSLTLTDVIRGTKVLASFVLDGMKPVSREEAERRAQVCIACPYNIRFPTPCTGVCGELLNLALQFSGNQGTQYDRALKSCNVCGCYNMAQIWIPIENLKRGLTEDMEKQFKAVPNCWKGLALTELENESIKT